MEYIIISVLSVLSLACIAILLIIYGFKEFKLRRKIELLKFMIDKDYEIKNIDLNNILKN